MKGGGHHWKTALKSSHIPADVESYALLQTEFFHSHDSFSALQRALLYFKILLGLREIRLIRETCLLFQMFHIGEK